MSTSITYSPVELAPPTGFLRRLGQKQKDALQTLVRIRRMSTECCQRLSTALEQHEDVPGTCYDNLHRLVENPDVIVLATLQGGEIASVSVGCRDQWAPCNDPLIHKGFGLGFMCESESRTHPGHAHRMQPFLGNILAVLVDPLKIHSGGSGGQGVGGAHIAAHLILQAQAGNERVMGFCPSRENPTDTAVYRRILQGFGFKLAGKAIFGRFDEDAFRRDRDLLLKACSGDPECKALALSCALDRVADLTDGKKVFYAMIADLTKVGLRDGEKGVVTTRDQPATALA